MTSNRKKFGFLKKESVLNRYTIVLLLFLNIPILAEITDHKSRHDHGEVNRKDLDKKLLKNQDKYGHDEHVDEHNDHDEQNDHDEHGSAKSIGLGKAILEVDKVKGLKLSDEAIKTLNLTLKKVSTEVFSIDRDSLVVSKSMKGIYRFRDNFFKYLPVTSINKKQGKYFVRVKGIVAGDHVVTGGVGLLRVTDVYSTDESEYGHGH
tara:strand:- start:724 stop:1341 length:618 start_codon:yes stop_codon:yes gene_type:complete